MKRIAVSVVFLVVCVPNVYAIFNNARAVTAYRSGAYKDSLDQFESLLTENPDDPVLNYNAGKSAYKEQEFQAAASYFAQAAKQSGIEDSFALQAWFDLGNTYVKLKKWQEALESYQKVLTYDNAHKEAKEMIEKIKKLLEDQQKQQQQQPNQQEQDQQSDQQQQNQDQQQQSNNQSQNTSQDNKTDKSQPQKSDNNQRDDGQQQDQRSQEQDDQQENKDEQNGGDASEQKDAQGQHNPQDGKQGSQEQKQGGTASNKSGKKQDLNGKDAKDRGEDVGEEGQSNKPDKDSKERGGDGLEDSIGDIQDHERKESSLDHSASPSKDDTHSSKQNTSVAAKAQAGRIDPFSCDDGIDKNSREGKILQAIEAKDAQAAQQLLKMNVQAQRKSGEKNW